MVLRLWPRVPSTLLRNLINNMKLSTRYLQQTTDSFCPGNPQPEAASTGNSGTIYILVYLYLYVNLNRFTAFYSDLHI